MSITPEQLTAYHKELDILESEFRRAKLEVAKKYALASNSVKIGDIIEDHTTRIRVEEITGTLSFGKPTCVYHGPELKKDGSPKKSGSKTIIWQQNMTTFYF